MIPYGIPIKEQIECVLEALGHKQNNFDFEHIHKFEIENRYRYKQEVCVKCGKLGKRFEW